MSRARGAAWALRAERTEPWMLELAPPFLPIGGPSPVPVSRGARALPGTAHSSGAARPWALGVTQEIWVEIQPCAPWLYPCL